MCSSLLSTQQKYTLDEIQDLIRQFVEPVQLEYPSYYFPLNNRFLTPAPQKIMTKNFSNFLNSLTQLYLSNHCQLALLAESAAISELNNALSSKERRKTNLDTLINNKKLNLSDGTPPNKPELVAELDALSEILENHYRQFRATISEKRSDISLIKTAYGRSYGL